MSKLIGISGKMNSGKDTFVNEIISQLRKRKYHKKIHKTAFADPIKKAFLNIFPTIDPYYIFGPSEFRSIEISGYNNPINNKPLTIRDVLIQLGAWGRSCNQDCWVMATLNTPEIQAAMYNNEIVLISDVRYASEKKYIEQCGGVVLRLIRPGIVSTSKDQSEIDLDNADFSEIITNDTIENLEQHAHNVIKKYILKE